MSARDSHGQLSFRDVGGGTETASPTLQCFPQFLHDDNADDDLVNRNARYGIVPAYIQAVPFLFFLCSLQMGRKIMMPCTACQPCGDFFLLPTFPVPPTLR